MDMDIIFLRDFKPILDQEYMYQWGSEQTLQIKHVLPFLLKKESEFSCELLQELNVTIIGGTTIWGKDLFASLWRRDTATRSSHAFFNTEWLIMKDKELSEKVEAGWFKPNDVVFDNLYLEAFMALA